MLRLAVLILALAFVSPASAKQVTAAQLDPIWHGMKMSCGERVNVWRMVASVEHGKFPCLSWVKVVSVETGEAVVVQVIDDQQFGKDHITILLSSGAADQIGLKDRAKVILVPLRERRR